MSVRKKCYLEKVTFLLMCVVLARQGRCQDEESLFESLLGASEFPRNETVGEHNQIPCPGQCVHAVTSILCSKIIEQFNCGAVYLRCCVSSDFTFGTVVETSAPLPEEASTEAGKYDLYLLTTVPNGASTTKQQSQSSTPIESPPHPQPTSETASSQKRPEVQVVPNPIRVPHIPNRSGYHHVPSIHSPQPHESPPIVKVAYQSNNNYGMPYQTQNFVPLVQKQNTSHELQPIRLTVLVPQNQPGSIYEEFFPNRRPNMSQPVSPHLQPVVSQPLFPSKDNDNEPVRLIPPQTSVVGEVSAVPIDNVRKQKNVHDNFVETAIGFAPDKLRPVTPNIPHKRPSIEKFYPPSPRPSFKPQIKNTSTILVRHVKKPQDHTDILQNVDFKPDGPQTTFVPMRDFFKPMISYTSLKPTVNTTHITFKPITPESNAKPPTPGERPKPVLRVEETIANPSNSNSYTISAEQAKTILLVPQNQPGSVYEEFFINRRPNMSQPVSPHLQPVVSQPLFPSKDNDNEPLRLIPRQPSVVGEVSAVPINDVRKQQNVHDSFVETAIGFAPDKLRPVTPNIPYKPPSIVECFYLPLVRLLNHR